MAEVVEVVLSGGPCSGKTSSLSYLSQKLGDRGLRVLVAPEIASQLILGGLSDIPLLRSDQPGVYNQVQRNLLLLQRQTHLSYRAIAESFDTPVVVIYDRAEMDVAAYTEPQRFQALMEESGLTLSDIRDSYDAVIHLVSAADGAEDHYSPDGNPARIEASVEEARAADRRTLKAWTGHPHLRIVDNSTPFNQKLSRVLSEVLRLCEHLVPGSAALAPLEYERKYLLADPPDLTAPPLSEAAVIQIEQTYLLTSEPGVSMRVRRRSQSGQATYYLTRKSDLDDGSRQEDERRISPGEYLELLEGADPMRAPIHKTRYCFAFESSYFELDAIERPDGLLWLLEVETPGPQVEVSLPPGLSVDREVTEDPQFRNSSLALSPRL